jgi:P27 family predicted phage terminase small subunit
MSGPPPIPTRLKVIRGNPGHQKLNKQEPRPAISAEPPPPPSFLSPLARDEWWRVAPELHRLGLLSTLDVNPLAAYCTAVARWQQAETAMAEQDDPEAALTSRRATGSLMPHPLLQVAEHAARDMLKFAAEFGLTPAARARVAGGVVGRAMPSKFDGLLG